MARTIVSSMFPIGRPTVNGRIYPRDVVETALNDVRDIISQKKMLVTTLDTTDQFFPIPVLTQAAAIVDRLEIENDSLRLYASTIATVPGKLLEDLLNLEVIKFTPVMFAIVEDNMVRDLKLRYIAAVFTQKVI